MTNERNALSDLFSACWTDDALKDRFLRDPRAVLAERGIHVPSNLELNVVENSSECLHITMPSAPEFTSELTDEELSHAAGGSLESVHIACETTGMSNAGLCFDRPNRNGGRRFPF